MANIEENGIYLVFRGIVGKGNVSQITIWFKILIFNKSKEGYPILI